MLVWVGEEHQDYIVKCDYSILNGESILQTSEIFKLDWSLNVAPSAIIGAWRLLLDRMPTRFNLVRRGVQIVNLQCPLCQIGVEIANHLFNTCIVV